MNMFKNYDGTWDYPFIGFFSVICVCVMLIVLLILSAAESDRMYRAERHEYKAKCIDAGGSPVSPFDYIKGHGEGYLCINPSAIIEVN